MKRAVFGCIVAATLALAFGAEARADEVVLTFATSAPSPNADTTEVFIPWAERVRAAGFVPEPAEASVKAE